MAERSKKISELNALTNASGDDLLLIVDQPGTANASTNKITLSNLFANVNTNTVFKQAVGVGANITINTTSISVGGNISVNTTSVNVGFVAINTTSVSATNLSGNGANITSVNATTVGGNTATTLLGYSETKANESYSNATSFSSNASNISSGTLNAARLPSAISIKEVYESVQTIANANGTIAHDCSNGHIFVHNTPADNFTANLTSLSLTSNNATTVVLVINQGATPYVANALHISGSSQTISWQGGTLPTGNANKKDILSFSIINLSGTYTVLGQLTSFG